MLFQNPLKLHEDLPNVKNFPEQCGDDLPLPSLRTVHEALLFQQEAKEGKHTARTGQPGPGCPFKGIPWIQRGYVVPSWWVDGDT